MVLSIKRRTILTSYSEQLCAQKEGCFYTIAWKYLKGIPLVSNFSSLYLP